MKTLLKAILLFNLCCFCSCVPGTTIRTIDEKSTVEKIVKNQTKKPYKYWVVIENYNFLTNTEYSIGDTVILSKTAK